MTKCIPRWQERLKRRIALTALTCVAVFIGGGAPAFGRPVSRSDEPPRASWLPPASAVGLNFSLSAVRMPADRVYASGVGSGPFSLQQQPFVEPRIRLRDDDPEYNEKSSWWWVAAKVFSMNVLLWTVDRFVFDYDYSHIGPSTWSHNLKTGWEWDTDKFGMNFFFHPFSGGAYFASARASGYNYLESLPFTFLGSLTWEYFGETTLPSYNDIINTTASGALFGEILYRITSIILDERTTGAERIFRELGAFILSPGRALSRLLQGKVTRVTPKEVYQKEPVNIALAAGAHWFNKGTTFGTGSTSGFLDIHLDYGDPFEIRPRKPFDFFKVRLDLSYGKNVGNKYLDNVIGYGLLFGKTIHTGDWDILFGAFQHYNYWDSKVFEIGVLGFGGGLIAKWQLSKESNFQAAVHLGLVPLAASNSPEIDIVEAGVHGRNYDYSGGGEFKVEGTLNLGKVGQLTGIYYYYGLRTYIGQAGTKNISIFKPRVALRLASNLSLGFEYLYYFKDTNYRDFPEVHMSSSEQKLYLMLYF